MRLPIALVLLLLAPGALAQPTGAIDVTLTLDAAGEPAIDAPPGMVRLLNATPGETYAFALALQEDYTTIEVRANGFDVERVRQLVPVIETQTAYPLFEAFPHDAIWDVDGAANVFHANGTPEAIVLRLGVRGPADLTLYLARDATPPTFHLGPVSELQHIGFYQETTTEEFAIGDLQVRKAGATEWVSNPTPQYHVRQRFPIQGLDADTEYEARVVFRDWAGNEATSDTYRVRTTPAPVGPVITITPLSPEPNATIAAGGVVVRARVESAGEPLTASAVRLFFDKREVTAELAFADGVASYAPGMLAEGPHSVAFEAASPDGGKGLARWSFTVAGAQRGTPADAWVGIVALAGLAAVARRIKL